MLGLGTRLRSGRLKLGLRLGGISLPDLDNTLGTSALLPSQVPGALPILIDIDARLTALGV